MASVASSVVSTQIQGNNGMSWLPNVKDDDDRLIYFLETYLFPIFAEANRRVQLPFIFYFIQFVIYLVQASMVGLCLATTRVWPEVPMHLKILHAFVDFRILGESFEQILPQLIVVIVISVLIHGFLISFLIYYHYVHVYKYWQLYFVQLFVIVLYPLTYPVVCSLLGTMIRISFTESTKYTIVFLVIYVVIMILSTTVMYHIVMIDGYNIIIIDTPLTSWDSRFHGFLQLILAMSSLIQPILGLFAPWFTVFMIAIQACSYAYIIYTLFFFPLHKYSWNAVASSLVSLAFFTSIFSIIHVFVGERMWYHLYFIIPLAITAVLFIIFYILNNRRKNSIIKFLSNPEDYHLSETEKREVFDQLVFSSIHDAICYIHIGFQYKCDFFIDFSFLRYMMENYQQPKILYSVAQMAALFPSELQFFSYCMSILTKFKQVNVGQHFLIYQLKRIQIIRLSSVSADASARLSTLTKTSNDAISVVRTFWTEIHSAKKDISFASLAYIRRLSLTTENAFIDAMDNFPNNSGILKEFRKFQVECMGRYNESITTGAKLKCLENGKTLVIDYAFKAFINCFPSYLTEGIMDTRGNFTKRIVSAESSTISSDSSNSFDDNDNELIRTSFKNGALRVTLQKHLKRMHLPGLIFTAAISLIQIIVCIVVYFAFFFVLPSVSEQSHEIYSLSYYLSELVIKLEYCTIASSLQYFNKTGIYTNNLENMTIPDQPSLLYETSVSIIDEALSLDKFFVLAMKDMILSPNFADENTIFSNDTKDYVEYQNGMLVNPRTSLSTFIVKFLYIHQDMNGDPVKYNETIKELLTDSVNISKTLFMIQNIVNDQGKEHTKHNENSLWSTVIIIIGVCFVLFCATRMYGVAVVIKSTKKFSDSLRKVSEEDINESLKPILQKTNDSGIRKANIHNAHDTNYFISTAPFVIFAGLVIIACFVFADIYVFIQNLQTEYHVYDLLKSNSGRHIAAFGAVIAAFSEKAGSLTKAEAKTEFNFFLDRVLVQQSLLIDVIFQASKELFTFMFVASNGSINNFQTNTLHMSINSRFDSIINSLQVINAEDDFDINEYNFFEILYLINTYVYKDFTEIQQNIIHYADYLYSNGKMWLTVLSFIGIFISFLIFAYDVSFIVYTKLALQGIAQLLGMLPPLQLIANPQLMNLILPVKESKRIINMTYGQIIMNSFAQGYLICDADLIISNINALFTTITGFTPSQVIGHNLLFVLPDQTKEQSLSEIISSLKQNSENELTTVKMQIITENGAKVPVVATILCIRGRITHEIESFCFLFKDTRDSRKKKTVLKQLKKRNIDLMTNLVPNASKDAISRKEKRFYHAPKATVIFIEIDGLSFYVHTMTATQMMECLDTVYQMFDQTLESYPYVHSMKIHDDLFIGCSGLFDCKNNQKEQVSQTVAFAFDLLDQILNVNEDLDIELNLRIGINTGGPLIGSILMNNAPEFDFIGDLIADAKYLQSEGKLGVVQVTKEVIEFVNKDKYDISKDDLTDSTYIVSMK